MNEFNDFIAGGLKSTTGVIGEPIEYKGKTVQGIFSQIDSSIDSEIYGDSSETFAEVVIASNLIDLPKRGDTFKRGGDSYKVSTFNYTNSYYEIRARLQNA